MSQGYEHLIGGFVGGVASTVVCHPLDLLKIRFSANEGRPDRPQYKSYRHAAKQIIKAEGLRGLYKGLSPSIIAAPASWGLYFHIYHKMQSYVDQRNQGTALNIGIGCAAGGLVMLLTNPLWVAKTRLCLQYENQVVAYKGLLDCMRKVWRTEGIAGYYKGLLPGLAGTLNGSIQFAVYNLFKDYKTSFTGEPVDAHLSPGWYLLFSTVSKIVSGIATFPYQVIRTRMQDYHVQYGSVTECCVRTWRLEGPSGFYKGMWMATLKQLPATVITYTVYEYARRLRLQ